MTGRSGGTPPPSEAKASPEVPHEPNRSLAAMTLLRERYLRRDEHGRPLESPGEMLDRTATFVAAAEDAYYPGSSPGWAEQFSTMLHSLDFLPNSPTLVNAGTPIGLRSGCVVLPLEDSLPSIFATLGQAAVIHQAGAGTGYSFSHLRPRGDVVASTGDAASGPLSSLRVFDTAAGVIGEGGRRRRANMAVLDVAHPDIYDFITAKTTPGELEHFNLSVGVTDTFLRAAQEAGMHRLVNPRTGRTVRRVPAADLFEAICASAHGCGDPGLLFLDTINRANPLPALGRIEATNPCGEVPLLPYESCNLGSINLAHLGAGGRVDWDRLAATVQVAVRFLDDVIDVSRYPFPDLEQAARATRKIGLGVIGLAELLASLGLAYDSDQAVRLTGRLARHIGEHPRIVSEELAVVRGPFPRFPESTFARAAFSPRRNAQPTSVTPTGTISLIAGTTAGIEPMFAISYVRRMLGRHVVETNRQFEQLALGRGFYSDELMTEIALTGCVRSDPKVPDDVRHAFPTALEIAPEWHLRIEAAMQRHVDAAVSKTVNLPASATVDDVRGIFVAAWRARVKGITVYRDGGKPGRVLTLLSPGATATRPAVQVDADFSGGCAVHVCEF